MKKTPILEVANLNIRFYQHDNWIKAVDDVSFQVKRGEILGIVGESGSGKSVSGLAIMRLLPEYSNCSVAGNIRFYKESKDPVEVLQLPAKQLPGFRGRYSSMVFQEPMTSLNPAMNCGAQVAEAVMSHHPVGFTQAKTRVLDLFRQVLLRDPARTFDAYPHELSGGEKQRVMIAIALAGDPDLLIADEPTTALDVTVQKGLISLLENLRKEKELSIIFISHDLTLVSQFSDRLAVMKQGKIVETGLASEVFDNPQHPYTKGLWACRPPLDTKLKRLPEMARFETAEQLTPAEALARYTAADIAERQIQLTQQPLVATVDDISVIFSTSGSFFAKKPKPVKALDGVSFEIRRGEIIGVVGESGSGKTTLGRCLANLQKPTGGRIIFAEPLVDAKKRKTYGSHHVQMVFQDPYSSLNPMQPVGKAIAEPMEVRGIGISRKERQEKTIALLEAVGLKADHYWRYPHEFSGGQRQRISIARALAAEPAFLVLDEPTSSLDVSIQAQIINLILDLHAGRDLTIMCITHDLSVVRHLSDTLLIMNQGKIVESGPSETIFSNPRQPYTQQLLEAVPKLRVK